MISIELIKNKILNILHLEKCDVNDNYPLTYLLIKSKSKVQNLSIFEIINKDFDSFDGMFTINMMELIEFIMKCEYEFNISIKDEDIPITYGQLLMLILNAKNN